MGHRMAIGENTYLEPASAPAGTKSISLLTPPATLPPTASIFAVASSRDSAGSVPVSTNVFPAKTPPDTPAALTFCFAV